MYLLSENDKINQALNDVVMRVNTLAEEQLEQIKRLSKIGLALSQQKDSGRIFDLIIEEALIFTNADAATIYSVSDTKKFLNFEIMQTKSKNYKAGGPFGTIDLPAVPLYNPDDSANLSNLASCVFHTKEIFNFSDCYEQTRFDLKGTKIWDKAHGYRSKSMLAIPLKNHEEEVLGVIQIINALDPKTSEIISFKKEAIIMVQSLASQAAITLTNRELIRSLQTLFNNFIRAIALAIDRKSKDTGGHIARVAVISKLIANGINESKEGLYKDFSFTENELDELEVASWLHDVGKIATPDVIMNKSKKLERVLDGCDLIKLRSQIAQSLLGNPDYLETAFETELNFDYLLTNPKSREEYRQLINEQLKQDLEFLVKVNSGSELLSEDKIENIDRISKFIYILEGEQKRLFEDNDCSNLKIKRGTLNSEERKIMNDHVKYTYEILNQLTYPKSHKNVTLYASSHHEKLDGSGQPWGLKGEQLPLQSRILAIADIFEALTASDRPYKKGNKLSEAMNILTKMVRAGHIDRELLIFLITSGIYKEYAVEYVKTIQIDEVDEEQILAKLNYNKEENRL